MNIRDKINLNLDRPEWHAAVEEVKALAAHDRKEAAKQEREDEARALAEGLFASWDREPEYLWHCIMRVMNAYLGEDDDYN